MTAPRGLRVDGNSPARSHFRSVSGVVPGIRATSPIYTSPLSMTGRAWHEQTPITAPCCPLDPSRMACLPGCLQAAGAGKPDVSRDYP